MNEQVVDGMRVLLMTAGSRGDVDPFLALGRRAAAAGHEVRVALTREFVAAGEATGLDVAPLDGDFAAVVEAQGVSALAAMRAFRTTIAPLMEGVLRSAARAAVDWPPDVIVAHPKVLSAPLAAAALGIPWVLVETVPVVTPTSAFPAPGVVNRDLGPLNRATYRAGAGAARMFGGALRRVRADLGLAAAAPVPAHARSLVIVSPTLLPRPADWPATTVITGQLHDPDAAAGDASLDAELEAFLSGPVLYAGFGSMKAGDPAERGRAVVEAARASGMRTLAATGWGGLAIPDALRGPDVLVRRDVPHPAVLPRCSVAVHHGGAGTSHAAVRAGVPSVVVPFLADQPFWGRLLHRRGLAGPPIAAGRLTAARLAAAIAAGPSREAMAGVATAVRAEDGTGSALRELEALAGDRR